MEPRYGRNRCQSSRATARPSNPTSGVCSELKGASLGCPPRLRQTVKPSSLPLIPLFLAFPCPCFSLALPVGPRSHGRMRFPARSPLLALAVALLPTSALPAVQAVFQYAVPVETQKTPSTAFLWIPPAAKQVRGVVIAGMTLMEREFVVDPHIRKACESESLALLFLKCGLQATDLQKALDDLAAASGYTELSKAPLAFVGHSAGGPQAQALAANMAARCFGLIQYRGGGPFNGEPIAPGVPTLMMVGQFDEFGGTMRTAEGREGAWSGALDNFAKYRAADPGHLSGFVVEPGAGHFAWSERNGVYAGLWIRKAARARIPATWPVDAKEPPALLTIDPKSGWLTSLDLREKSEPSAASGFTGDTGRTAWTFDEELARATLAYHIGLSRKDQFIKWNDPFWVDAGTRFFFTNLNWVGDGSTFEVHPSYSDTYPKPQENGGPRWPQAGQPVGHASAPILVRPVSGPVVAAGPNTFRMRFDGLSPVEEGGRVTFLAYSAGDEEFRYTEQVGMMPRGFKGLGNGKDQTLTFPELPKLRSASATLDLKATSSAGLPVQYYVAYGPAVIADGKLKIAEVPARAKFPVPIKVVAWQFGSGVEPQVKSAAPVEQLTEVQGK